MGAKDGLDFFYPVNECLLLSNIQPTKVRSKNCLNFADFLVELYRICKCVQLVLGKVVPQWKKLVMNLNLGKYFQIFF